MKNATALFSVVVALLLSSCAGTSAWRERPPRGTVERVVLVWLKHPVNSSDGQSVIDSAYFLKKHIPQIQQASAGNPPTGRRAGVDGSFHVGMLLRFASEEDLAACEKHPVYQAVVKHILNTTAKKVVIHDVVMGQGKFWEKF